MIWKIHVVARKPLRILPFIARVLVDKYFSRFEKFLGLLPGLLICTFAFYLQAFRFELIRRPPFEKIVGFCWILR